MSLVGFGMDALLGLLLVAALAVGVRLNGKLTALRTGQAGFVKAVGELDGAAMRAEAGLASLRAATLDAHDHLLGRIETARALADRLDHIVDEAESTRLRVERATAEDAAHAHARAGASSRGQPAPSWSSSAAAVTDETAVRSASSALARFVARRDRRTSGA